MVSVKKLDSFKLGSVRCKDVVNENVWQDFKNWITENAKKYKPEAAIGSGGNINKMHRLCGYRSHQHLPIQDFREKVKELEGLLIKSLWRKLSSKQIVQMSLFQHQKFILKPWKERSQSNDSSKSRSSRGCSEKDV